MASQPAAVRHRKDDGPRPWGVARVAGAVTLLGLSPKLPASVVFNGSGIRQIIK